MKKCWCKYPFDKRNNWNVSAQDKEGAPNHVWPIKYCPVCGKFVKMKREAKVRCHEI